MQLTSARARFGFGEGKRFTSAVGMCWAVLGSSTLLACSGAATIPDTPNLSQLRAEYDNPTAALDETNVADTLAMLPSLPELAAGFRASALAPSSVDQAGATADRRKESRVRLQGSLKVSVRCPGQLAAPVFDDSINGSLSLTFAVAGNRIRHVFGGQADNCALLGHVAGVPIPVRIDGPFVFDVYRDIGIGTGWSGEFLAVVYGDIDIGSATFTGVTAHVSPDRFEYLFTLPDGQTVVAVLTDTGVAIRDRESVWSCSFGLTCARN